MYTIKAFVDGKEYTLHNPKIRNLIVGDPYYQKGDNVNGQASFSVYPKHPYYQYVKKLTTDIVIYKDDVEKFAGRVLYDDQDSKGVKKVFVEGELAYFCDSVQRPNVYHNISVRDYVSKIIDNHNAQVEERKQFTLGRVTVTDPNDSLYRYANWESTRDTLKTKLVERLGGHLVIRKENGVRYLDYLSDDDFYRQNTQEIRFGKNLLDYSENMDASDLVTCVIPLGATLEESSIEGLDERLTISSVNGGVDYVSSSEAIAAYGKICKTVTWDDVTVPANLLRKGKEYLKSTQFENMVLNIKAVDLNLIDSATQEFEVGDLIRCISPPHGLDTNMPLSSITVYLTNLSKNTVTLGSEKSNSTYTSSNAEKASKLDETIKSIPGKREILQEALRNATDLMNDMTKSGYAIHEKNEFIVADAAGAKTATNLWRWGLGGLAHYSHGYDGPIDGIALTMNGQINGKMLMANSVTAEKIDVAYTETIEGAISDAAASSNEYTDKQQKLLKEEVGTAIKNTENRIVLSASSLKEYVSRKNYIVNGEQETLAIGNFSISGTGANAKVELTEFLNMKCLKVSFSASATVQIKQSVGTLEASIYTICCDAAFEDGKQPANLQVGFSDSAATNDLSSYSPGTFRVFKHSVKTSEEKEKTVAITVRGTSGTALYLTNIRCLEDLAEIVDNVNSSLKIEIDNVAINVDKKFRDYSTTEETSSMIQTKINEINLAISNAYATKDQLTDKYKDAIAAAEKAAGLAEKNAKDDTTNRLKSYSTTVQMNSAIKVATDAITLGVSQTYVTQKTYEVGISNAADDAKKKADAAEKNAKDDTTKKLTAYSSTKEMNAAIKVATDGITSNVSKTYVTQTTYESGISSAKDDATKKANTAEKNAKDATANSLKSYSTTEQMNSAIKQKADSIETEVSKKVGSTEIISKINQSPESVAINASKISLNGAVTANSNFKINTDGSAETKALKITGGSLEIGGNCEITRKGDVFALSPKFVSGMYLSNEVSIGVELSKKSYSMIMGYVGKDIFVGESASTLRGYGFTANNDIYAYGKLGCMGEKTRIIHTDDGRNAEMYAYETASPTFGDIGTGKIDNDGYCYVYLENDFLATIEKNMKYHVTLTAKGPGELYIESTNENDGYFLVKGTPKLEFYWEVRVRQKGCRDTRIEESNIPEKEDVTAEDQEMINEQIRNQAILLCEMEKDENEVRDEQSNLIERMEELS